ncbi:MAG: hypothetical protein WD598_13555 [Acidimicrobiia bacterium]
MTGPVVDTVTAEEFMREALAQVSEHDLVEIATACERKAEGFGTLLGDGRAAVAGRDDLGRVLRSVFAARRKADAILDALGPELLAAEIDHLLHGDDPLPGRIDRMDRTLQAFPEAAFDLPAELLHFTYPDDHWPWTRWMWDPNIETGSLRLVTMEEFDLTGATRGETYLRVGQAIAFVQETGRAAGFTDYGPGPFGIDVFLGCVYGVYMYTVLRMRMTQEFNKIVPELPDLVRRLLGVKRPEV